jgi:bifunctional UDP-N-acetylglucosamine pyrophosphorylase/glucosamine-1-phosphate N-acetyltransferase
MKSSIPKVLHPVCGRPMLGYVLDLVAALKIKRTVAVLGYQHAEVKKFLAPGLRTVIQKKLLGTADAVKQALPALKDFRGPVVVLYADTPLLKKETIEKLVKHHLQSKAAATLLSAKCDKPAGYGRLLRDKYYSVCGIAEDKDADDFQKEIKEINTGIICFDKEKLAKALKSVKPDNAKKEYYLTDCIRLLYEQQELVEAVVLPEASEALGINSRLELAQANKIMQKRLNDNWMKEGISIVDPQSTFINYGTKIGAESVIYPFTVIENDVKIGKKCSLGPFAHLRPGTRLEDNVAVGNFIEVSRSRLASKTRAKHFGFLGDARIGRGANIGAGTVTANYDGKNKNVAVIGEGAFIGCDTVLVAPVRIGAAAKTGAGCVVTRGKNVAKNSVVVGIPARPLNLKSKT